MKPGDNAMKAWLVTMCKADGSTPLGESPEYELEAEDYISARAKAHSEHPGEEIVSLGLKSDIERFNKEYCS